MPAPNERQLHVTGGGNRRITEGSTELRDRSVRRRTLHRDCFPPDLTGGHEDVQEPSWHPVMERTAHERGASDGLARADHNHDFSYPGLGEARVLATADPLYTNPFENIGEGENPFVPPGVFHMRSISWSIKEGFEDRVPFSPVDVWIRFDPAGGTAYGEWEKVGVAPPGVTQVFYEPYPWNFNPNIGVVCSTDVRVIPRISGETGLRLVRSNELGKIDDGWIDGAVPSALPVPVAEGGTGATTAAGARTNLGAPSTLPVPVAEGGTGATTPATARQNLEVPLQPLLVADGSTPGGNTVANTTSPTSFASTVSIGTARFAVGKSLRVTVRGLYGATSTPTIAFAIKLGSTTVLSMSALTLGAVTAKGWHVQADILIKTAGASGFVEAQGAATFATGSGTALIEHLTNAAAVSVDLSAPLAITVAVTWGAADPLNTITARTFVVEGLGVT